MTYGEYRSIFRRVGYQKPMIKFLDRLINRANKRKSKSYIFSSVDADRLESLMASALNEQGVAVWLSSLGCSLLKHKVEDGKIYKLICGQCNEQYTEYYKRHCDEYKTTLAIYDYQNSVPQFINLLNKVSPDGIYAFYEKDINIEFPPGKGCLEAYCKMAKIELSYSDNVIVINTKEVSNE